MSPKAKKRRKASKFILVMKRAGDNPVEVLKKARIAAFTREPLQARKAQPKRVECFKAGSDKRQAQRVFHEFGLAAVDLTEKECGTLQKMGRVAAIVPNLQRRAMGKLGRRFTQFSAQDAGGVGALGGSDRPVTPFGGSDRAVLPFGSDRTVLPFGSGGAGCFPEYVRGMRDACDLILRQFGGGGAPVPDVQDAAAAKAMSQLTRSLIAIGITGGTGTVSQRSIKVAVLDTGLDRDHPDFVNRDNIRKANMKSFIDGDDDPQDSHGHGTHCCGIVAGPVQPTGAPRYGVAPEVELLVGKVLDDDGFGMDSDILEGITWAAEQGAKVISLSLGGDRGPGEMHSPVYERVADRLFLRGIDTLLVAATGNESERSRGMISPVADPAACPSFMGVGAVDDAGRIADFSNGQVDSVGLVDIVAPGIDVLSSFPGGYAEMSGTSMATPHVAGAAALYFALDPSVSAHDIWHLLEHRAGPIGDIRDFGRGLVRVP